MQSRFNYYAADPASVQAMLQLENHVKTSGIDLGLLDLIKLRASQINGCAYCVDMHTKEAKARGETEQRLNVLCVWRESPAFTEAERAALAWTEAVTLIASSGAPDEVYQEFSRHFDEALRVKITLAIGTINVWNRLAVSFRAVHPLGAAHA